jgi:SPP1 family predicted phage head-tail adaptor
MDIGRLNRRVEILAFVVTRDDYGGEDGTWQKIKDVWAYIKPISGTEFFSKEQPQAENTTTIIIRFTPQVTVLNRIKYKNKIYEIIGVNDSNTDHTEMVLNCKEIVSYGV